MPETIALTVNGKSIAVAPGVSVAAAVLLVGPMLRLSVSGGPRGPLCGMGTCFECRVAVNGRTQQRSCQMLCEPGMIVTTDG